jgi:bifunctional non-homologous end joining protein LigD
MAANDRLAAYRAKRDFRITSEPGPEPAKSGPRLSYVIQKHHATRLHYDFRLELNGTLLSWAVPKGPSLDPKDKRLAVHVEDHPISYGGFEGTIPKGQYGAGEVIVWDRGVWTPESDNPARDYHAGKLKFRLDGEKLHGRWALVRTKPSEDQRQDQWLLMKEPDEFVRPREQYDITGALPDSVIQHPLKPSQAPETMATPAEAAAPTRAADLDHARKAAMPATMSPQLATLVSRAPAGGDWLYEIKLDGYRLMARLDHGEVRLFTRAGKDWTEKLRPLADALAKLKIANAWIDGEIVVLDEQDRPSFQLLQNAFEHERSDTIDFVAFDLPYADGHDLRKSPLQQRRALLKHLLAPHLSQRLRFSETVDGPPEQLLQAACGLQLEGLIGKRADAAYAEGRTQSWIKLKCQQRQEFVIVGFTEPKGSRNGLGALLLAVHDDQGRLQYAGRVGTGFDTRTLDELRQRLDAVETRASAVADDPRARPVGSEVVHWVKPMLVCEVAFTEWTGEGSVRHATFQGLRNDKPASQIVKEKPVPPPAARPSRALPASRSRRSGSEPVVHGLKVSHPERVIDSASGVTKLELVEYYQLVAPHILPHLKARPVALVRAPDGITGELFFQKHVQQLAIPKLRRLGPEIDPPHPSLIVIDNPTALVGAAQMGVVELHTWNAVYTHIDKPDRIVFDLDPGEGLPWARVVEAAELTKTLLDELGLVSFLKTSGGKGLHIVVPLQRRHGWDFCKDFSQAVTLHLARTLPQRFAAKMGAKNRVGKVFVDYLRNNRGATSACAFSARARPHLGVSVPVAWDELVELRGGDQWTIRTLPQRLDDLKGHDPWADYEKSRQTLTVAARLLAGDLPSVGDEDPDTELPEPASPTRKRDPSASARARSTRAAGAPAGRASASRPAAASKAEAKKTGPKAR